MCWMYSIIMGRFWAKVRCEGWKWGVDIQSLGRGQHHPYVTPFSLSTIRISTTPSSMQVGILPKDLPNFAELLQSTLNSAAMPE